MVGESKRRGQGQGRASRPRARVGAVARHARRLRARRAPLWGRGAWAARAARMRSGDPPWARRRRGRVGAHARRCRAAAPRARQPHCVEHIGSRARPFDAGSQASPRAINTLCFTHLAESGLKLRNLASREPFCQAGPLSLPPPPWRAFRAAGLSVRAQRAARARACRRCPRGRARARPRPLPAPDYSTGGRRRWRLRPPGPTQPVAARRSRALPLSLARACSLARSLACSLACARARLTASSPPFLTRSLRDGVGQREPRRPAAAAGDA